MDEQPQKSRKPLDEESLKKLAAAREKALVKRRELAAQRAKDKEALVQEKMQAKAKRLDTQASKEAELRADNEATPAPEEPKVAKKAVPVVIETSDDEEDISNARVYFVKRDKPAPPPRAPPAQPARIPHAKPIVDPHAQLYRQMFG